MFGHGLGLWRCSVAVGTSQPAPDVSITLDKWLDPEGKQGENSGDTSTHPPITLSKKQWLGGVVWSCLWLCSKACWDKRAHCGREATMALGRPLSKATQELGNSFCLLPLKSVSSCMPFLPQIRQLWTIPQSRHVFRNSPAKFGVNPTVSPLKLVDNDAVSAGHLFWLCVRAQPFARAMSKRTSSYNSVQKGDPKTKQ